MIFFDTHIHLTDIPVFETVDILPKNGIKKCVCVSAKPGDWEKVETLADRYSSEIVPSFGFHPWYISQDQTWREKLRMLVERFENAAIGECGFDKAAKADWNVQKDVFDCQLELALEYKRPLILHVVKSENMIMPYFGKLPLKSVFHSFSGSVQMLKQIIKFNHYLSVNKRFFRKKNAVEILKSVPIDRLLMETDAPFQSAVSDLKSLVEEIAKVRQEDTDYLAQKLYLNAEEVFCYDR